MANQDNGTNFMDTIMDAQKGFVNTVTENTKKLANGNTLVNETIEKGSEWYKNWLENQKNVFAQTTEKVAETTNTAKANTSNMTEFFQNWYNTQMNWGKQIWEMNQNAVKEATQKATSTNPMEQMTSTWNNWMSQMNNMTTGMNNMNSWMNNMQQFSNMNPFSGNTNPFNMDSYKNVATDMNGMFNQWNQMLTNGFSEWQNHLQNGTTQDAFRNMLTSTESFTRFYEMWAPMWKSIQDKTFNTEMYKNMINPAAYQELMDKFFGFMPEGARQYMQQMSTMMQNGMKQMGGTGMNGFNQMRQMMGSMPGMNGNEMFGNMLSAYTNMQNMMQNAVSPIAKMITPNKHTKSMAEWQDIADRTMVYNIKNAQLQYMMYNQGTKVMDKLAESIMHKMEQGQEVKSIMDLYQEWMGISDKTFVSLFESDEYSQLMAEVSSLQLKLKKDMEGQMEKMLHGIPVATRSEMDEMYKAIYDLKKEVRQLEKMLDIDGEIAPQTNTTFAASTEETATEAPAPKTGRGKKA